MEFLDDYELKVSFEGRGVYLNPNLLTSMNAWSRLEDLKEKHLERLDLESEMSRTISPDLLKVYDALYTLIEFELQELWGFPQDSNFHRFWNRPGCICPKLDNEDRYGLSQSVKNLSRPLHGD